MPAKLQLLTDLKRSPLEHLKILILLFDESISFDVYIFFPKNFTLSILNDFSGFLMFSKLSLLLYLWSLRLMTIYLGVPILTPFLIDDFILRGRLNIWEDRDIGYHTWHSLHSSNVLNIIRGCGIPTILGIGEVIRAPHSLCSLPCLVRRTTNWSCTIYIQTFLNVSTTKLQVA